MDFRYFDHNATTRLLPEAKAVCSADVDALWLNPSSPYRAAAGVKVLLEAARERLAKLCAVSPNRVVFNSGATEGNNAVLGHWARSLPASAVIAVSPTEHPSVLEAARYYFGERIAWLALDGTGAVDLDALQKALRAGKYAAVSVMAANNETGVINKWAAIAELCETVEVPYHCDASQWFGKLPLRGFGKCSYVVGCAHKFGGPRGVGFMLLGSGGYDFRSLRGGVQEGGYRAGTEDVPGIRAMITALELADTWAKESSSAGKALFLDTLAGAFPDLIVIGAGSEQLWNTVSILMPDFVNTRWIRGLEKRGFLISAGSACSTGKQGPSHVLTAMGVEQSASQRVLRISSGWKTSEVDWKALADAMVDLYDCMKAEENGSSSQVITI